MRRLIFGAGAIGGYLGGLMADAGADVTLLARGAQYHALADVGIKLEWADGCSKQIHVKTCEPGKAGSGYDLVIVTLKSMQLAGAADEMMAALAPHGSLVMIQNGLPWWYFDRVDSHWRGRQLASLDAEAELRRVAGNFNQTPSMLQDLRAGRPLEWDAILNVIIEIAELTGVAVPALRNVAACIGLLDQRVRADGVAVRPVDVRPAAIQA